MATQVTPNLLNPSLGSFRGLTSVTSNTTLSASLLGNVVYASGSVTQITLPVATSITNGETITIHNIRGTSGDVAILPSGSDTFSVNGAVLSTLVIKAGDYAAFYRSGLDTWYVIGTAALQHSYSLSVLASSNGYQKLPSGFIIQWGSVTATAAANTAITFPISFTSACFGGTACPGYSFNVDVGEYTVGFLSPSLSGATIRNSGDNGLVYWTAYGK